MITENVKNNQVFYWVITVLSILIPALVCFLFYIPQTGKLGNFNVSIFPHINAFLNTGTSICLILGYYYIKRNNVSLHRVVMVTAFILSSLFLVFYVIYHFQGTHTFFGDVNHNGVVELSEKNDISVIKYLYYSLLITHIILAGIVVPLVLFALYFGITNQIIKHKKIVKYPFPIWLYVAVTGVIVYLMIKPYY